MNNSHDAIVINSTNFKKIAKKLKKQLSEQEINLNLTAVNEVFAKSLGYRNYDALHSALNTDVPLNVEQYNNTIEHSIIQADNDISGFSFEKEQLYKLFFLYMKQHCILNIISKNKKYYQDYSFLKEEDITESLYRITDKDILLDDNIFIETLDAFFSFSKKYMKNHHISYLDFFKAPFLTALGIAMRDYHDKNIYYSTERIYFDKNRKNMIFSEKEIEDDFLSIPNIEAFFNFMTQCFFSLTADLEKTLFSNDFLHLFINKYYGEYCPDLTKEDSTSHKIMTMKNHIYYSASFFSHYQKEVSQLQWGKYEKINHYFITESQKIFEKVKESGYYTNSFPEKENLFILLSKYDKIHNTKLSYKLFDDVIQFNSLFAINYSLLNML